METEPTYVFVKGQGWVATSRPPAKTFYRFRHSGVDWIFEHRDPMPGEFFLVFYEVPNLTNMARIAYLVSDSHYKPEAYAGNKMEDVTSGQWPVVYRVDA